MIQIRQFRYGGDNLSYVAFGNRSAVVIDGGAVEGILSFFRETGLRVVAVTNTHGHGDHTVGNRALIDALGEELLLDTATLLRQKRILLDGQEMLVYHTPGHTEDSVTFHLDRFLVTGDTLFNGTVGNCFSGDLEGFYRSIRHLMGLPADTVVYAGHDYVQESMAFARNLEPQNRDIDAYLARYRPEHVRSTLGEELRVNPYLRFNEKPLIAYLRNRRLPAETEYDRWHSLMTAT